MSQPDHESWSAIDSEGVTYCTFTTSAECFAKIKNSPCFVGYGKFNVRKNRLGNDAIAVIKRLAEKYGEYRTDYSGHVPFGSPQCVEIITYRNPWNLIREAAEGDVRDGKRVDYCGGSIVYWPRIQDV